MIKAVIFDLDGTLVDSLQDLCDSTNFVLEKYGFPTHEREKFYYFVGNGIPKLIERALPKDCFTSELHKKVLDEFMGHYRLHFADKTAPFCGIGDAVKELKKAGIKLAVVSNKADEMTRKVIEKLFSGEFSLVVGKQEDFPLKPDPTLTLEVIKRLGVKPQECAFVGDSGVDMQTAGNADCVSVGVLWGFRPKKELEDNGAEYLLENPSEIAPFILGLK